MIAQDRFDTLAKLPLVQVGKNDSSFSGSISAVREIFRHREMLGLLVRRDIKSRYKDSVLGLFWTLVRPITQLLIYYIVLGKFLGAERGLPDFAIYIFTGLTAYGLFSEIVASGTSSIVGNAGLIKKVYLPREVFPLASVGSALFNFAIQLAILLIATAATGHFPISENLIYFVPAVLVLLTFGTAFAILLSAMNVYLRDTQYLVEVVLLVLMWASPVIYGWAMARDTLGQGVLLEIYSNNPVTLSVLGFQKAFWLAGQETTPYPDELMLRLWIAFAVGVLLLIVCQRIFAKLQGNFAQAL
jgi:ABC-2 type transport system permease protein